jgi:2,3-bisphosphoglycerate-independent phosphoglycerate mutase
MPDHPTPCELKTHSNEAVPFAIVTRDGLANDGGVPRRYTEANAAKTAVVVREGYRLIDSLFAKEAHSANN